MLKAEGSKHKAERLYKRKRQKAITCLLPFTMMLKIFDSFKLSALSLKLDAYYCIPCIPFCIPSCSAFRFLRLKSDTSNLPKRQLKFTLTICGSRILILS
jgi:hypothetical protein